MRGRATIDSTASLFFCRYFYREEMREDRYGKPRPHRLRHAIIGSPANQVTAKVMADHFCRTIRRLARDYAAGVSAKPSARRSFEAGCAERLCERIWRQRARSERGADTGSRLPALLDLFDREAAANDAALAALGITLSKGKRPAARKRANVLADHLGRAAADEVSLALQIGAGGGTPRPRDRAEPSQMGFGF